VFFKGENQKSWRVVGFQYFNRLKNAFLVKSTDIVLVRRENRVKTASGNAFVTYFLADGAISRVPGGVHRLPPSQKVSSRSVLGIVAAPNQMPN